MLTCLYHYPLRQRNSFGLDVRAAKFVEYSSVADLQTFVRQNGTDPLADTKHPLWLHIGGGNNLLFTDDYQGVILHSALRGVEEVYRTADKVRLRVGAAEHWDTFVAWSIEHGAYGLENLSLIPSEVGAAAVQNIGAYGAEAKDFIYSVEAVDLHTGEVAMFANAECNFAYRFSNFKGAWAGRYAITYVIFELALNFVPNLSYHALAEQIGDNATAKDLREAVIRIRRGKLPEPAELGNAGSFFMNPVISPEQFAELQKAYPAVPHFAVDEGIKVPAAWLIEQAGWKGRTLGSAGVYEHQPLVLVNRGDAVGADIVRLADAIIGDVKAKFAITLRPEVIMV